MIELADEERRNKWIFWQLQLLGQFICAVALRLVMSIDSTSPRDYLCILRQLPVYEGAGESFAHMDLNQDELVQDLDGEESAVVAEIVGAAESTFGLQKRVWRLEKMDSIPAGQGTARSMNQLSPWRNQIRNLQTGQKGIPLVPRSVHARSRE
jgi:hypothetical protein